MAKLRLGQHADLRQKLGRNDQLLLVNRSDDEVLVLVLFVMCQWKHFIITFVWYAAPFGSPLAAMLVHSAESLVSPLWR